MDNFEEMAMFVEDEEYVAEDEETGVGDEIRSYEPQESSENEVMVMVFPICLIIVGMMMPIPLIPDQISINRPVRESEGLPQGHNSLGYKASFLPVMTPEEKACIVGIMASHTDDNGIIDIKI